MSIEAKLKELLDSAGVVSGIGVCLYDLKGYFVYDTKKGAVKDYAGHYCDFCKAVRDLPGGDLACLRNDREDVAKLAQSYGKPFFNICHAGLCELIVPVTKNSVLLGIIFLGQCIIEGETHYKAVYERIKEYGADREEFHTYFRRLPKIKKNRLISMGNVLDLGIKSLVDMQGAHILAGDSENKNHIATAIAYIDTNYMSPITSGEISEMLFLNPSYLSRIFKRETGMTVTDYIIKVRIDHAMSLLAETDVPIESIAVNVGYTDKNYFSRIFKKTVGVSPSTYRQKTLISEKHFTNTH